MSGENSGMSRERRDFLRSSLPGGMLGGYLAPGLPLYFINRCMLEYLDYADEAQLTQDTGGLLCGLIHPHEREQAQAQIEEQLARGEEFNVEYRMRRRDGAYIWVHQEGRRAAAEDGRAVFYSVIVDITRHVQARQEVLSLYNNIPGAVFRCLFDADFTVLDANDGLFEFLGYTREEFAALGGRMSAVIYPDDLKVMTPRLQEQLLCGNTIHNENRLICKDGTIKWISIKAQLLTDENETQYFYCVFVDITEEKQLRQRERELYQKEVATSAQLAAAQGSIQGRLNVSANRMENYLFAQDTAVARVGDSYDDVILRLADCAVDTRYGETILRTMAREKVLADYAAGLTDYHFEFLRRRTGGTPFWASTNLRTCMNPETGDVIAFFYTRDVTSQKLQDLLLDRIAHLDYDTIAYIDMMGGSYRLISHGPDLAGLLPVKGHFQRAIGLVAEKYMDSPWRDELLTKLDFAYIEKQLSQRDAYDFVVQMRNQLGETRVKRLQVFYISRELNQVCLARADVTELVRKEQRQKEELAAALVAAEQANAAKSDFLSRMSHEIRTPMNAIIGMSTIAAQAIGDDEQVADCIAKIGISSRFLLSLINDILDMSRIESGKMLLKNEKIPTEEFLGGINSICYSQAESKGVEYECIVDPVLDDYYIGDAMKLQQVLINILGNAIKFTAEGGKVTFSVQQRRKDKKGAWLRFIINDTGVGMSEEFMPHIFEPFSQEATGVTTPYGGTGLGLAICKNIVDMMDGKITVRSIKGIGSEFTVDVKLGITEEERLRHNQKKAQISFAHLKTLVVDDDVAVCESAVSTLAEMGITAHWVDSGRKAVEEVRSLWTQGRYYDMILIDWKMPEMDGLETARRIRAIVGPEVTIIIMTAYDWVAIEHEAKLCGVNLLMSKPMFKSTLISAFTKALGQKEDEAQARRQAEIDYNFSGHRVLLAEDNQINTEVAMLLLESKGFQVETAENGLRALELFSKSPTGYYDAILMDIRMPLMDGLTAAMNIRHLSNADAASIPIIAMTANAFDDDIEKSKAAGMNAHLAKPVDPQRLYQTLYSFISTNGEA